MAIVSEAPLEGGSYEIVSVVCVQPPTLPSQLLVFYSRW